MYPCPTCAGSGRPGELLVGVRSQHEGVASFWVKCPDCTGGVASCCDTAGGVDLAPAQLAPDESTVE
jgi:hypothetical protein